MACTRKLHNTLVLSVAGVALGLSASSGFASDRGFTVIAGGGPQSHQPVLSYRQNHQPFLESSNGYRAIALVDATDLIDRNLAADLGGSLRQKVSYAQTRSLAKIIHVSDEMKDLGEIRAARRESRMLQEIDTIEFGFYRDNEAYDVRFPSIVYLDKLRK